MSATEQQENVSTVCIIQLVFTVNAVRMEHGAMLLNNNVKVACPGIHMLQNQTQSTIKFTNQRVCKSMLRIHDMSNSLLASTTVLHSDPLSHGNICSDLTDYPFVLNVFLFPSVLSSIQVGLHGAFASYVLLLASACILI